METRVAAVFVAQVGMRVELEHAERLVAFARMAGEGAQGPEGDGVFAPS